MKYYKVTADGGKPCHGGKGQWHLPKDGKPGEWMPFIEDIELCESGYHLCRYADLVIWLHEEIWLAEYKGEIIEGDDKVVVQQARLIRKLDTWNEKNARLFAADCAERVLHIYEKEYPDDDRPRLAIAAARDYANEKIDASAMAAAWSAARSAVWSAAKSAAWSAEREWQTRKLFEYLGEQL